MIMYTNTQFSRSTPPLNLQHMQVPLWPRWPLFVRTTHDGPRASPNMTLYFTPVAGAKAGVPTSVCCKGMVSAQWGLRGWAPIVLVSSSFEYLKGGPITRVAMALYFNRVPKRVVKSLVRGSRLATFSPQGFNLDTSRNRSEPDAKDAQGKNATHSGFT